MKIVESLEKLHLIDREYRHLEHIAALLRWDQETYLSSEGVEDRAEQLALLESIAHQMGKGEVLNNNQIWNSFKTRSPQEIIPHAEKMLRESGKFGAVMNFFGNSNKGDNQ